MRVVFVALFGFASQAAAQDGVPPIESCEALYSVQKHQCAVEHVFRCDTPDGTVFRYDEWEQADGTLSIEIMSEDGDFLRAWDDDGSFLVTGRSEVRDAMSTSDVLGTGKDEFDLTVTAKVAGMTAPVDVIISGKTVLMGPQTDLDGVLFQPARNDFQMDVFGQSFAGFEIVMIDLATGAVVGGEAEFSMGNGEMSTSGAPVGLIFAGEPGFLEDTALFDCEVSQ